MDPVGIYISVPFCSGKCTFCNFASDAFPAEQMGPYVRRLCAEVASAREFADVHGLRVAAQADSLFLGGGTPTLLSGSQLANIFHALHEHFLFSADAEITTEAAPGQISDAALYALLKAGVNRISLGVQSFVDAESRTVGRTHNAASCLEEISRLREAGIRNLNVDLIAGLPHQTSVSWQRSLEQAIESGVEHVSVYMLEVDEDSRLGRELIGPGVRYGAAHTPDASQTADLYVQACETLNSAGLEQYEISNFAQTGFRSRHNLKYWTRQPYLGLGLDAHSMLLDKSGNAVRSANGDNLDGYIQSAEPRELERVDQLAAWEETIFLGLRLVEGVSVAQLRQSYPSAWVSSLRQTATELSRDGLMQFSGDRIALTQRGRIVSSSVFGELLAYEAA